MLPVGPAVIWWSPPDMCLWFCEQTTSGVCWNRAGAGTSPSTQGTTGIKCARCDLCCSQVTLLTQKIFPKNTVLSRPLQIARLCEKVSCVKCTADLAIDHTAEHLPHTHPAESRHVKQLQPANPGRAPSAYCSYPRAQTGAPQGPLHRSDDRRSGAYHRQSQPCCWCNWKALRYKRTHRRYMFCRQRGSRLYPWRGHCYCQFIYCWSGG